MTWLPQEPSPNVKIIFSLITDTVYHKNLMLRKKKPKELFCDSLNIDARSVSLLIIIASGIMHLQ